MSRLRELIERYCPDGVEYKALGDLAEIGTGSSNRNEAIEEGEYPFYVRSATVYRANHYDFDEEAVVVPGEGNVGDIFHCVKGKYALHQRAYRVHLVTDVINNRYLYWYMRTHFKSFILSRAVVATVTSIRKPMFLKFPVAIPPIEVQREVVRILDEYTAVHDELVRQLEKEITLRTVSLPALCDHEICRSEYKRCPIREVGQLERGRRFTAADYVEDGIPSIHYGEIYTSYGLSATKTVSMVRSDMAARLRYAHPGDVVIACTGENKDDICKAVAWLGDADAAVHDDCQILHHDSDPRYIAYALMTSEFHDQKVRVTSESKVVRVSSKKLASLRIPLPPIEKQHIIADRLDEAFDAVNDLIVSLDKERLDLEQQLTLTRTQILSFPERVA